MPRSRWQRRVLRVASSFAIVVAVYWTYALAVVALVEPAADPRAESSRTRGEGGRNLTDHRIDALRCLFPAGAWELDNPKILESDQLKLLMCDYHNLGNGRMEIHPCTIIFTPGGPYADDDPRNQQAIVLQAPEGAALEFDKPLNLRQVEIGRPVGGQLMGPITIRSRGKQPGDELLIVGKDFQLKEHDLSTPNPVDFRWGRTQGRGSDVHIKLTSGEQGASRPHGGADISGIESFEVRHVERLHLETAHTTPPGGAEVASTKAGAQGSGLLGTSLAGGADWPVEITCAGPFRFDPIQQVATFQQQVNVWRLNPNGPADQLACNLLSIYFTTAKKTPPAGKAVPAPTSAKPAAGPPDLVPQRLEARGDPVILSSPSRQVHARGQRMEYDLQTNRIVLDGGAEVMLQQGPNEIHGRSLQYQAAEPGRLGQVVAVGPGYLRGQMADRPEQQLEAQWKDELRIRPHQQSQLISLTGGAALKFPGIGQLDAGEIYFWLLELPQADKTDQAQLRPDRMLARDRVRIASEQLSGAVEQLEIWFEQAAPLPDKRTPATEPVAALPAAQDGGWSSQGPAPAQAAQGLVPAQAAAAPPPPKHFDITGRLLRVKALIDQSNRTELSELLVEDEARFAGGGLALSGPNINLNSGSNRLWIDGAGRMELPLDRDLENRPVPNPVTLQVDWRERMVFDGRIARFEDSVVAATPSQSLRTPTLEVQLQQPVRFADPQANQNPQVEQLRCSGGALLENRSFDEQGLLSHDHVQVLDLNINVISGALNARGPGTLSSVRRGAQDLLAPRGGGQVGNQSPAVIPPAQTDPLKCLQVRFQGSITGNVRRRSATFHDQVQTIYAPIDDWDATLAGDTPEALGPGGVVLHCDDLSVSEMATPSGGRRAMEFVAAGNTRVESTTYTALCQRMTYDEAKDLLILEGDGWTGAQLFRQQQVGAATEKATARLIHYWPKTNKLSVVGRSLELSGIPAAGVPAAGTRTP